MINIMINVLNNSNESLNKRFEIWMGQASIDNQEIINLNNKKMREYFESQIKDKITDQINLDDYINLLKFGIENKIELVYLREEKVILGLVKFDKYNGGRIGLVHGGCLFFTLLLCLNILSNKEFKFKATEEISGLFQMITTKYLNLVPINLYHIIKVRIEKDEIIGEIINNNLVICTKTFAKLLKAKF